MHGHLLIDAWAPFYVYIWASYIKNRFPKIQFAIERSNREILGRLVARYWAVFVFDWRNSGSSRDGCSSSSAACGARLRQYDVTVSQVFSSSSYMCGFNVSHNCDFSFLIIGNFIKHCSVSDLPHGLPYAVRLNTEEGHWKKDACIVFNLSRLHIV